MSDRDKLTSLASLFLNIIDRHAAPEASDWLRAKAELVSKEDKALQLNMAFSQIPRLVGRQALIILDAEREQLGLLLPGLDIEDWSLDQLARVWLLMQLRDGDKEAYLRKVDGLFNGAEMYELAALYAALSVLSYPESWIPRCTEGIRSNIGIVLEAIMYANPYPATYLDEAAWNQLVLKAFFTDKDVTKITGIRERVNVALSDTLKDYIREREAAHRDINPEIPKLIINN
ncbi:EboA domain-containing protein [Pedobacter deserti]|uniref:EboA domain-containing protein n=1 Tax=Pedobacter deserti TaxID=2817382 RepID=UPI00210DD9FB|nr:EboA domain-containing protein [Pedobacter sp. SYSU D00382]